MIGFHAYRQVAAGVGGGEAIKQCVRQPVIRAHLEKIGQALDWHGALSIDCIMPGDHTAPLLIDCNPRLVEPMNAYRDRDPEWWARFRLRSSSYGGQVALPALRSTSRYNGSSSLP